MVQLTEEQILRAMDITDATREEIMKTAATMPELGQWLRWGIVKTWSCARAITCLGPVRKIYWAIVCVQTTVPI